ncbi:hypothetical protein VPH35_042069 [Triticum aestivum]
MALNDGLARFRLQQERNQAILSTVAATRTSSSSSTRTSQQQPAPTPRPAAKPSPSAPAAVRFSDDTARLQKINEVRTSTVGSQLKKVIELLEKTRDALTAHQINEQIYVDIDGNNDVADSLRNNAKVRFDRRRYSYKPTHDLKAKGELLTLIKSLPDGLLVSEVKDTYPANREKPATDTVKRRAAEQVHGHQPKTKKARKKSRGITSRTKITNAHLPWLLDLPVDSKDII